MYKFDKLLSHNLRVYAKKVNSMADLGVHIDSNLIFRDHISDKNSKAYTVLGTIKRNSFIWIRPLLFRQLLG